VCSEHFVDGKPTPAHPYPTLKLGHEEPPTKSRRPPTARTVPIPSTSAAEVDVAPDDDGRMETETSNNTTSLNVVLLVATPGTTQVRPSESSQKHKCCKKVKQVTQSTQTSAFDFIDDQNVKFYTGLPKMSVLLTLISTLQSFLPKKKFRSLSVQDQILLTLMRLRLGLLHEDLAF